LVNADATCAMAALALSDTDLGGDNFAAKPAWILFKPHDARSASFQLARVFG
jgi:hypothetical protein